MSAKPIDDEVIDKVLRSRVPGGSEVWHWINGGGMKIDDGHRSVARKVIEAYVALTAAQQQGQAVFEIVEGPGEHRPLVAKQIADLPPAGTKLYDAPPPSVPEAIRLLREYRKAPKFSNDHDAIKRTVALEDEIDAFLAAAPSANG